MCTIRPNPEPRQSFAEASKLDRAGLARVADVLAVLLECDEPVDLIEWSARIVGAYVLGSSADPEARSLRVRS